ncbi:lysozyme inhibitor LprI family protein [Desulfolutivibrio sp.]|uniref:lysozyme inhibitor LprI family protein n=1 Tax=Desulfolutivibrio sp. TaxID=2773296 RepID=UPI002F96AC9C
MSRCARIRPAVFFAVIAALLLSTPGTPVLAGHPIDAAFEACRQKAMDTASIGQCTTTARQQWDKELNAAYAALMQALEPGAREALKASERAWIGFRDAEIKFLRERFSTQDGTIWPLVEEAQVVDLTRKRAIQLRCYGKMMDMEGPPDAECP